MLGRFFASTSSIFRFTMLQRFWLILAWQYPNKEPNNRRDAAQHLVDCQAGPTIEKLANRIADPEKPVRDALKAVFQETLLSELNAKLLAPFTSLLMAHICSAMTHLQAGIRLGFCATTYNVFQPIGLLFSLSTSCIMGRAYKQDQGRSYFPFKQAMPYPR